MANQLTRYATVATVDTADQGYFFGVFIQHPTNVSSGATFVSVADQVDVFQFVLPFRVVVGNIVTEITGAGGAGKKYSVGLYSADGNTLLVHTGALAADATGILKTAISPTVTLEPGVYFFAQTTDDGATTATRINVDAFAFDLLNEGSSTRFGNAANTSSAGVLPATLGTITPPASRNPIVAVFES